MTSPTDRAPEVVLMTPALARELLRHNTCNRPISERSIINYSRDMAAVPTRWQFNGDTIKIAEDGSLLDGQHRLQAVVRSNTSHYMALIRDLPRETQDTMDAGRKRTAADMLSLHGEANAHVLGAVLRRVWMLQNGDAKFKHNATPTSSELKAVLEQFPDIRRAADIACRTYSAFRYIPASVVGTSYHMLSQVDTRGEVVPWFFQRIADGADLQLGHPILALRNRAMSDRANQIKPSDQRSVAYVLRAWNALMRRVTLANIIHPADTPLPAIRPVPEGFDFEARLK